MLKRLLILCLSACLAGLSAYAQEESTLFRGLGPKSYPFKFNGTYYWQSDEFMPADICYNGKQYQKVLSNIDAHTQNLLVIPSKDALPILLNRDQVAWFRWNGYLFVNLQYLGYPDAPDGFFEVLKDDASPVLRQRVKAFKTGTDNVNGDIIGYTDPNYNPEVVNYFEKKEIPYTIKDGKVKKLKKKEYKKLLAAPLSHPGFIEEKLGRWHGKEHPAGSLSAIQPGKGIGLPDTYFTEITEDTLQVVYAQEAQQASYLNKLYRIGVREPGKTTARVEGFVTEKESGTPLPGTVVYDEITHTYTRTDKKGYYSLELPVGDNILHFVEDSREEYPLRVQVDGSGTFHVSLAERITLLKEAVISASSMENHRRTAMGVESVSIKTFGKIPSAFGEGDVLRGMMTLPGVKSEGEASGGFHVRGGSADENLILFNENTIYNPSHLFGIFSAFNPDIVSNVELYKSSIPAEYGGRLSSVMKVDSKDGDMQRIHGSLGLGLVTGRFHLEGPIVKNKTSFIAGARTTYSDWILGLLPKESAYSGGTAGFTDANVGLTHRFSANNTLQASFYYAADRFALADKVTNRFSNWNASLQYRHRNVDGVSFSLAGGFDHYDTSTGEHENAQAAYNLFTHINQAFLKGNAKWLWGNHTVSAGASLIGYGLDPGILAPFGDNSQVLSQQLPREYALEPAIYLSDTWQLAPTVSIEGGLRLAAFYALKDNTPYIGPEVRISAKYSPLETLSFKAGFQTLQQYIHLISNTTGISPLDTWKLSDSSIKPTRGMQVAGGVYWTHVDTGMDFSVEGYWKQSSQVLDYKTGAQLSMNPNLAEDLIPVRGRAYGVEVMIKKPVGKLTGWISYAYSRSQLRQMETQGQSLIAGGGWYNSSYDKPHEFKLVANWAITHRFSFSANVDYATGRAMTVPMGYYYYKGAYRIAYSQRNAHRIPDNFRVDLAVNIDPGHSLKALVHASVTLGIYNVLGRKNPYSVYFDITDGYINGHLLSVFATQVPYINLNILF